VRIFIARRFWHRLSVDRQVFCANVFLRQEKFMEKLLELARKYCASRNLDADIYIAAMCEPQLDDRTIETLIRYHKEWMR